MAIVKYVKFDINDMPFEKVKGRDRVDIVMMQAIGIVEHFHGSFRLIPLPNEPQAPPHEEDNEESEDEDADEMTERMDNLELQMWRNSLEVFVRCIKTFKPFSCIKDLYLLPYNPR